MSADPASVVELAQYLERTAGLAFDESRRPGLTAVLNERLAGSGLASEREYLALLTSGDGAGERQALLDAVTIQETFFFRNTPQIDALRGEVLPELLRAAQLGSRPLRIWSAGCSTGEEPYTLSMVALDVMADRGIEAPMEIVATDVSKYAIDTARAARYSGRTVELAEPAARARWFDVSASGVHTVSETVRERVDFRLHNLVRDDSPFEKSTVDLVVCRNVTIYFARSTTRDLMRRFQQVLRPGGYLLLGHAETLWQVTDAFDLVPVGEAFVYRLPAPVQSRPQSEPLAAPEPMLGAPRPGGHRSPSTVVQVPSTGGGRWTMRAPARVRTIVDVLEASDHAYGEAHYDAAANLAEEAIRRDSLVARAYVCLARAMVAMGRDDVAVEAARRATYLEPADAEPHFLMAGALSRLGQDRQAAVAYRATVSALGRSEPSMRHQLLDGRSTKSLVALCEHLAAVADGGASAVGASFESGGFQ